MRSRRSKPQSVETVLIRLELIAMGRKIMAAIDDANATLDSLGTAVSQVEAKMAALEAADGVPEGQVAALGAKAQQLLDRVNALAVQA